MLYKLMNYNASKKYINQPIKYCSRTTSSSFSCQVQSRESECEAWFWARERSAELAAHLSNLSALTEERAILSKIQGWSF